MLHGSHLTDLNGDGVIANSIDSLHDCIDFSQNFISGLHVLGRPFGIADGDLTLRCCRVIFHAQSDRYFSAEIPVAREYGALGDGLQQAGLARTPTADNNDAR